MGTFTVETTIKVPHEKVWAVAGDFTKSPGPSIPVTVEKDGDLGSNGIGCERSIRFGKSPVRERLIAIDPPNSFTYVIFSGAPLKSYKGKMEFIPEGDSTRIRYNAVYESKIPGTGWIIAIVSKKNVRMFINELKH